MMLKVSVTLFALCLSCSTLYAAQGTIEETESAIIVEYTGDAAESRGDAVAPSSAAASSPADDAAGSVKGRGDGVSIQPKDGDSEASSVNSARRDRRRHRSRVGGVAPVE